MATKMIHQGSGDYSSVSAYTWDIITYSGHLVKSKVKKDEKFIFTNDAFFFFTNAPKYDIIPTLKIS